MREHVALVVSVTSIFDDTAEVHDGRRGLAIAHEHKAGNGHGALPGMRALVDDGFNAVVSVILAHPLVRDLADIRASKLLGVGGGTIADTPSDIVLTLCDLATRFAVDDVRKAIKVALVDATIRDCRADEAQKKRRNTTDLFHFVASTAVPGP
ncbi:MAG TPA: hypothetical protein VGP13_03535 [Candidatus Paceibacterota bacterium]|nr:hypothetical protein [Candidatus Paceibacterota bacterium]